MQMLSFIIPAYNEENNISNTIDMIKKYVPDEISYEIILVDHGSKDNTSDIAREKGCKVLIKDHGTIAGLRNYGAENAQGDILIFIDADVHLTNQWQKNIRKIITEIRKGIGFINVNRSFEFNLQHS